MNVRIDRNGPRRVLITGATSGVGEATARLFADEIAEVALLARRGDELRRVADELGGSSHVFVADVADPASVRSAVREAIDALGGLDVAVNAAGLAGYAALEELDDDIWRRVIDTNLSGTFTVSREAGLHMRAAGGGSIVNVASDLAGMGVAGLAHYCASKAGVLGLTRALALELAPRVRVNAVCPGPIDTRMMRVGLEQEADPETALREKEATVPLQRLAHPAEVARAIRFLAVEGTFATGTSMAFDGGTSAA
ncbi:SDR family NAD(P)-dependent oxidoreductase [Leucobacter sp. wl10]|uniref:SDR family NAD(P)-dependent oxidoreductase n=1 Tax=Leucobacter sp. wl10 TaxID=2304677 RepID=UPI000E5B0D0A|nr:SDR family NAD(P)-dependent oxidoreductase [Leucobacter sp. wl10]RGE19557.1 SDR family oxidoreductase [Leucobacter sp. wl10]